MSHVSGGTPYSNNFVTEQYIGSNTVTPMSRVTQERYVTSPIQSKDQPGIRSINRSATSQESSNGTNEDEHEFEYGFSVPSSLCLLQTYIWASSC
jgi:hypothetical protein